jgi:Cupin domain
MAIALKHPIGPSCPDYLVTATPVSALELREAPDARRQPAVSHTDLTTTIQVTDGVVYVISEDDDWVLAPGDSATIPAGRAYRRWNAGDDAACWVEIYCAG